jgi:hypothetical protein
MQLDGEAEPLGVERDRCIDVVDDVADANSGHRAASLSQRYQLAGPSWRPTHQLQLCCHYQPDTQDP